MIKLYFSFYRRSISDAGVEWCGKWSKKRDKFKAGTWNKYWCLTVFFASMERRENVPPREDPNLGPSRIAIRCTTTELARTCCLKIWLYALKWVDRRGFLDFLPLCFLYLTAACRSSLKSPPMGKYCLTILCLVIWEF